MSVAVEIVPTRAKEIIAQLEEFEHRFEMPSSRFMSAFKNGRLRETPEFLEWSTLYTAWKVCTRGRPK